MPKIHVLDINTINKIAAGEVIERPASALKELIENALDAGATRIDIELQSGGKSFLLIRDNGCGMTQEEALLALQRHATSKIQQAEDLFAIHTLGFRGEALPSIASISRMTLRTLPAGSSEQTPGTEIVVEGGTIAHSRPAATKTGTTVIVENLFYNVPARLKFLKSDATELSHCSALLSRFILSNPAVAFTYTANSKLLLQSPGAAENSFAALQTAAAVVFGAQLAKKMTPFEFFSTAAKVRGLLANPVETKVDRTGEYFFVNNRSVTSIALSKAVEEALRDRIPHGRFPICTVFLEIKPDELDVNIHPAKREVKFLKQNDVFSAVLGALRAIHVPNPTAVSAVEITSKDPFVRMQAQQAHISEHTIAEQHSLLKPQELQSMISAQSAAIAAGYASAHPGLHPVAQINKTYIVALDGEDLVLVDQHVAHERVLYDQLKQKAQTDTATQELLLPETIELSPQALHSLQDMREPLLQAGFRWEDFGETTVLLRGVPTVVTRHNPKQVFCDIIDDYLATAASFTREKKEEEVLKMISCKGAIKAGEVLTLEEMHRLLVDLMATTYPQTCPHGRPIMIAITKEELDKKFGR